MFVFTIYFHDPGSVSQKTAKCSWDPEVFLKSVFFRGLFCNRTGTSVDNGARIKNTHKIVELYNELCKTRVLIGLEEFVIRV